jgi:hypothetical protein
MGKTKKRNQKSKTSKKRRRVGGTDTGFVGKLRQKTRRIHRNKPESERRQIINPNRRNRSDRYASFLPQVVTPPKATRETIKSPTWQDSGFITDNEFGPSKEGFYAGPSIKYGTISAIPHGKDGTILYPTGHVYTGDFVKGLREGMGKLQIQHGPIYEGEWKNDKFTKFIEWKENKKNTTAKM